MSEGKETEAKGDNLERREMMKKTAAVGIGGLLGLVPTIAGLMVFLDPLRKSAAKEGADYVPVTPVDNLTADGPPQMFKIFADRRDAWNKYTNVPIGAVYLRLLADGKTVQALSAVCPHLGCAVDTRKEGGYMCPCHNSLFTEAGEIDASQSGGKRIPSPRDMDTLDARVETVANTRMVMVKYQKFRAGIVAKVPKP